MTNVVQIGAAWMLFLCTSMMAQAQLSGQGQVAGSSQESRHVPSITVNAREVVFDVIAIDSDGHSVAGLKKSDFILRENGVPQVIKDVSEHSSISSPGSAVQPLPINTFSNFVPSGNTNAATVILIDALNSPTEAQIYLRQQLIAFTKTLPPGNTCAVFQIDTRIHLIQGFTSDPEVLLNAMESKRDAVKLPLIPNHMQMTGPGAEFQASAIQRSKEQILDDGFKVMGRYLAGFPGRKNLIWFTNTVPTDAVRDYKGSAFEDSINSGKYDTAHSLTAFRNPFPDSIDFDNRIARAANALSLSQVAIYPIDDAGVGVLDVRGPHYFDHLEMDLIADATGGQASYNTNDLKEALTEIVQTSSDYYTLAYSPSDTVWKSDKRNIELTVTGRKVTLLYRHAYYARGQRNLERMVSTVDASATPSNPADLKADARQTRPEEAESFHDAMELGTMSSAELQFNVNVTPAASVTKLGKGGSLPPKNFLRADFKKKPFRNYQLLYNLDPNKISFARSTVGTWHARLNFVVVVYNNHGEVLNSSVMSRDTNLDETEYRKLLNLKLDVNQVIAVPENGNYFLRVGVHDLIGGLVGSLEISMDNLQKNTASPNKPPLSDNPKN